MNLNYKQVLAILGAVLSVLVVSTAQLTDIFGAGMAKIIVSASAMANTMINSVLAVITGQASQVKDVLAMPGVEKLTVNRDANMTLAQIAIDPAQPKISPTAVDEAKVAETAHG